MPNGGASYGWCMGCQNYVWVHYWNPNNLVGQRPQWYCDPCIDMWFDYYRWWTVYYVLHGQVSVGLENVREDEALTWLISEYL